MRILDRYIGKQVLIGTLFAVTVLSLVLVMGSLFKFARPLLVEQRAPISQLAQVVISVMPATLMFTLPWGFLAAVLLVIGRLSSGSELVGMRMAGNSLPRIAAPVFVIGALLSVMAFYINADLAPAAKAEQKSLIYRTIRDNPGALLDPGVVQQSLKEGRVYVEDRDGEVLKRFHFYQFPEIDKKSEEYKAGAYVYAEQANLVVDRESKQLRLSLTDAYFESADKEGVPKIFYSGSAEPLLFDVGAWEKKGKNKPSGMTSQTIMERLSQPEKETPKMLRRLKVELAKRSSFSMACLSFAFIGVPLAIGSQRRDSSRGITLSLVVAGAYFIFLIAAEGAGDAAPYVLWLPNIICILLGCWLLKRAKFR